MDEIVYQNSVIVFYHHTDRDSGCRGNSWNCLRKMSQEKDHKDDVDQRRSCSAPGLQYCVDISTLHTVDLWCDEMVYECVEIEDLKQKILLSKMLTIRFGQNSETNIFPSLFESQLYHVPLLERRQTWPLMSLSPGNLNVNKSQLNSLLESLKSITRVEINFILIISLGSWMGGLIWIILFFVERQTADMIVGYIQCHNMKGFRFFS